MMFSDKDRPVSPVRAVHHRDASVDVHPEDTSIAVVKQYLDGFAIKHARLLHASVFHPSRRHANQFVVDEEDDRALIGVFGAECRIETRRNTPRETHDGYPPSFAGNRRESNELKKVAEIGKNIGHGGYVCSQQPPLMSCHFFFTKFDDGYARRCIFSHGHALVVHFLKYIRCKLAKL